MKFVISLITRVSHLAKIVLSTSILGLLLGISHQANAVIINFSAFLTDGTCTFSLDKSTLNLGSILSTEIKSSTIAAAQPFTLQVRNCTQGDANLSPAVLIKGEGQTISNRWHFRDSTSTANHLGVMLFKKSTSPNFNDTEVKANDIIYLADKGVTPTDQNIAFYAGVSCGSSCSSSQDYTGTINARIVFELAYR